MNSPTKALTKKNSFRESFEGVRANLNPQLCAKVIMSPTS